MKKSSSSNMISINMSKERSTTKIQNKYIQSDNSLCPLLLLDMKIFFMISTAIHSLAIMNVSAQQCGIFCGVDVDCESQCRGNTNPTIASGESGVDNIITSAMFDQMLEYRNDPRCKANGLYTYSSFIAASKSFPEFGTVGDYNTRRRELAAFFGQTSHETTGNNKIPHRT